MTKTEKETVIEKGGEVVRYTDKGRIFFSLNLKLGSYKSRKTVANSKCIKMQFV